MPSFGGNNSSPCAPRDIPVETTFRLPQRPRIQILLGERHGRYGFHGQKTFVFTLDRLKYSVQKMRLKDLRDRTCFRALLALHCTRARYARASPAPAAAGGVALRFFGWICRLR